MGATMSAANLALVAYLASDDRLFEAGLVNDVSRDGEPKAYVAVSALVAVCFRRLLNRIGSRKALGG